MAIQLVVIAVQLVVVDGLPRRADRRLNLVKIRRALFVLVLLARRLELLIVLVHGLDDVGEGALHDDELDLLIVGLAAEDDLRLLVPPLFARRRPCSCTVNPGIPLQYLLSVV